MRQLAIFHEKLKEQPAPSIRIAPENIQSFSLNSNPVTTGLVETRDTVFDPGLPENRQKVLIRKRAFSCNYRDKAVLLSARNQLEKMAEKDQIRYYSLGSEFSAEVVSVGTDVQSLKPGDRVIGNGNYPFSDYEGVNPGLPTNHGSKELEVFHFSKLVKIPDSMPDEIAAGFPIGGQTCYSMIRKLRLCPGERVLVTAATSNTSLFAIAALKNLPVTVCAITTRDTYTDRLKALGADEVFVVSRGLTSLANDPAIRSFVQEHGSFNAVIDPFFDIYLNRVIGVMDLEARYTTCGMYFQPGVGDEKEVNGGFNHLMRVMSLAMIRNIQLIGNCIGKTADLEQALRDYDEGKLEVVIDSVYQNDQAAAFFERSFNSPDRFGKVIFKY